MGGSCCYAPSYDGMAGNGLKKRKAKKTDDLWYFAVCLCLCVCGSRLEGFVLAGSSSIVLRCRYAFHTAQGCGSG